MNSPNVQIATARLMPEYILNPQTQNDELSTHSQLPVRLINHKQAQPQSSGAEAVVWVPERIGGVALRKGLRFSV